MCIRDSTMNQLLETPEILDTPDVETPGAADLKAELRAHFDAATCSAEKLAHVAVPPREPIVGGWFKQGDLGFIYGARGLGKTWLAMLLARKCVEGGSVADWNVHKPRGVLYVDGEMPLDGIRERDAALSTVAANGMFYLQHEALFHLTGQVLNLTNPTAVSYTHLDQTWPSGQITSPNGRRLGGVLWHAQCLARQISRVFLRLNICTRSCPGVVGERGPKGNLVTRFQRAGLPAANAESVSRIVARQAGGFRERGKLHHG